MNIGVIIYQWKCWKESSQKVHKFTKFAAVPKIDNDDPSDPQDIETINGQSGASNHQSSQKNRASKTSSREIPLRQNGHVSGLGTEDVLSFPACLVFVVLTCSGVHTNVSWLAEENTPYTDELVHVHASYDMAKKDLIALGT